jgi:Divergent PAP2 family
MYDASGVRLHAGKQASVLNMIITELPPDHPVSDTRPLRDTLGHTPLQVWDLSPPPHTLQRRHASDHAWHQSVNTFAQQPCQKCKLRWCQLLRRRH